MKGTSLKGGVVEKEQIPLVIDELPMLAALGPYTEEGIEIRDAAELRVKDSDRIAALAENLRRMGATLDERPDGLRVEGRKSGKLRGAEIDPRRSPHRHGLRGSGPRHKGVTTIRDATAPSLLPKFYEDLSESPSGNATLVPN